MGEGNFPGGSGAIFLGGNIPGNIFPEGIFPGTFFLEPIKGSTHWIGKIKTDLPMFYLVSVFRCAFHMVACIGNNIARIVFSMRSLFYCYTSTVHCTKNEVFPWGFFQDQIHSFLRIW